MIDLSESTNIYNLLGTLNTTESKLNFLRSVYIPGNTEIADIILSINPEDTSVLESEINYAIEHGTPERAHSMAEKYFDQLIEDHLSFNVKDKAIELKNDAIADLAIAKLTPKLKDGRDESAFGYAVEIAEAFSKKEKAKELLTEMLKYQLADSEYPFMPAATYAKLGRYDEAIDSYLKSDYGWINNALKIAKEYAPDKLSEVAKKGFDNYKPESIRQDIYVECAKILGKVEDARKALTKEAGELQIDKSPGFYEELVKALVYLGLNDEAKDVVAKIAEHEIKESEIRERYDPDVPNKLAALFNEIGGEGAKERYLIRVNRGLKEGYDPSKILATIAEGFEVTQDSIFIEKKIVVLEQAGNYAGAAKVVAEMGDRDLSEKYLTMDEMIQKASAVQTPE